ncbi:hypothetical protein [Streptomyces sioyaensis]|uniref:hypothetical protein n=1 Tax=Streptomyces sioyaensis TaxID=67364 RepID=UPI00371A742D
MTIEYESHGLPLDEYQLSRADHRRQREADEIAAWVERQVAKAPPWSEEQYQHVQAMLDSHTAPPPWEYMRWRVRLYCGHIQEIERHCRDARPDRGTQDIRCSECGKNPAVMVAFEMIGAVAEPPKAPKTKSRNTASDRGRSSRRTRADLEAENSALHAEVERLRRSATK